MKINDLSVFLNHPGPLRVGGCFTTNLDQVMNSIDNSSYKELVASLYRR